MMTSSFFSFLYNDPELLKYNTIFAQFKAKTDLIKIDLELDQKMAQRLMLKSVQLGDDVDYTALRTMIVNASIDSQVLRSRLCHMHIEIHKSLKRLNDRSSILRKYLFATYRPQLEAHGLKTQADKNYVIDSCFLQSDLFLTELTTLKESIVFFIEDLDKNLWTLKSLVDVLEISFKTRTNV